MFRKCMYIKYMCIKYYIYIYVWRMKSPQLFVELPVVWRSRNTHTHTHMRAHTHTAPLVELLLPALQSAGSLQFSGAAAVNRKLSWSRSDWVLFISKGSSGSLWVSDQTTWGGDQRSKTSRAADQVKTPFFQNKSTTTDTAGALIWDIFCQKDQYSVWDYQLIIIDLIISQIKVFFASCWIDSSLFTVFVNFDGIYSFYLFYWFWSDMIRCFWWL